MSALTYCLLHGGDAIECLECRLVSWNPNDVRMRYCGQCHKFHEDQTLGEILAAEAALPAGNDPTA